SREVPSPEVGVNSKKSKSDGGVENRKEKEEKEKSEEEKVYEGEVEKESECEVEGEVEKEELVEKESSAKKGKQLLVSDPKSQVPSPYAKVPYPR
ncbi:hypothetical protein A2U01_0075625, partial [Trifolium medium]|nr:hypothetical protein [Trifolium medium]